jgi:hypothetical protein
MTCLAAATAAAPATTAIAMRGTNRFKPMYPIFASRAQIAKGKARVFYRNASGQVLV